MKPIDVRETRDILNLKNNGVIAPAILRGFIKVTYTPDEHFPEDACVRIEQGKKVITITTTQMRSIVKWLTTDHNETRRK